MCIKRIVHRFDGTEGNSKISMALREGIKILIALREFTQWSSVKKRSLF